MSARYVPPHLRGAKPELRYKTIVIPVIDGKYVVVRDTKSQNITFIGGGCKQSNLMKNCAVRELSEETKNSIRLQSNRLPNATFSFTSKKRSKSELANDMKRGLDVTMVYTVFIVDLNDFLFNTIHQNFHTSKNNHPNKETNNIYLMSRNNLANAQMWNFMKNHVLPKLK
jgi:hypothetical protein